MPPPPAPPPGVIPPRRLFGCLGVLVALFLGVGVLEVARADRKLAEARALVASGQGEAGAVLLRELLASGPRSRRPEVGHELAAVELGAGRREAAETAIREALSIDPGYRPPSELEAKLAAGVGSLARLRFEANVGRGPWEGLSRPAGERPAERAWILVLPVTAAARTSDGAYPGPDGKVAELVSAYSEAYPERPELEVDVLIRRKDDHPDRLAYLGRCHGIGLSKPPVVRFLPAPKVLDEALQPERDRSLIRRLELDSLAYYWLTVRLHRGGPAQVAALVEAMQKVDSKVFHRFLEWDEFLIRESGGDGPDDIRFPLAPFAALPDAVILAGAHRFRTSFLGSFADGWSSDLGRGFRAAAKARGLAVE